jgi:hypothetical protein
LVHQLPSCLPPTPSIKRSSPERAIFAYSKVERVRGALPSRGRGTRPTFSGVHHRAVATADKLCSRSKSGVVAECGTTAPSPNCIRRGGLEVLKGRLNALGFRVLRPSHASAVPTLATRPPLSRPRPAAAHQPKDVNGFVPEGPDDVVARHELPGMCYV